MLPNCKKISATQALVVIFSLITLSPVCGQEGAGWVRHDYGTNLRYVNTENSEWMKALPDELLISQLSIPGTHETMSTDTHDVLYVASQCNSMALETQLNAGIRLIDIRARISPIEEVEIWHNIIFEYAGFIDVLTACKIFLMAHPSETIIMRLQQTGPSKVEKFYTYIDRDAQKFQDFIWKPDDFSTIPSLGEVRGKIVILQDFPSPEDDRVGLDYMWTTQRLFDLNGEEFYSFSCLQLADKWNIGINHILAANANDGNKIFVTSLVGSGYPLPPTLITPACAAIGVECQLMCGSVTGLNEGLLTGLQMGVIQRSGMIMMDFPGAKLIEAIIDLNNNLVQTNRPPTAICQNVTVSADSTCTASTSIDKDSYDPDGDPITMTQYPSGPYPLGNTPVTLIVTDNEGSSSQCTGTVTVVDNTSPTITEVSINPSVLWPPNRKMVLVTPTASVTDNCDPGSTVQLTSITINDGDETSTCDLTIGDGNTTGDIRIDANGNIYLRAERSGAGSGRTYTLTYTATDASGNSAMESAPVTVPHNKQP